MLKKILSALFSIFLIAVIVVAVYFNQQFVNHQIDKVKGLYYVYQGDKAYKVYNVHDAILYYNKGLNLYPKHYGAWHNLGNIYVAYEDYYAALHAYSQAFKYNPKMMIARMNYGIVSSELLGDFDSALKQYDKVIKTNRKLISIPYIYNNKLSSRENKAIAYYNIGVTYRLKALYTTDDWELQRKYLNLAIKNYEKSIKIYPDSYDAQYNLGTVYHIVGDYGRAGRCYCKAINVAPMNYEAHYNLALLLKKLGHYQEAYDEIDKATTLISALDENSGILEYVATVMNEISRNVYQNEEYKRYRKMKLAQKEYQLAQKKKEEEEKKKKSNKKDDKTPQREEKFGETITSQGIEFVNGKIVATDELDEAILNDFGQCPSYNLFDPQRDDW